MSFGIGLGDICLVSKLAWSVYRACKTSSKEFQNISRDVSNLRVVLEEIHENLERDASALDARRRERLQTLLGNAHAVLLELQAELAQYDSLTTTSQRKYDVVRFGFKDVAGMRSRITSTVTSLTAFEHSLARHSDRHVRKMLLKYLREVHHGLHDGSVLTTSTADSVGTQETWAHLRRELEALGIDASVLREREAFIKQVLRSALEEGLIDEADLGFGSGAGAGAGGGWVVGSPSESGATLPEGFDPERRESTATLVDELFAQREERLLAATAGPGKKGTKKKKKKRKKSNASGTGDDGGDPDEEEDDDDDDIDDDTSTLVAEMHQLSAIGGRHASKKHGRLALAVLKVMGMATDERLIEAADEGDLGGVLRLLRRGVHVDATEKWRWTALHMAAYGGFEDIARALLLHGARLDVRTVDGETPLALAERGGHHKVVLVIEEEVERRKALEEMRRQAMLAEAEAARTEGKTGGVAVVEVEKAAAQEAAIEGV